MHVFFMDTCSDPHESLQTLEVGLYHEYTLDGCNFLICDKKSKAKPNLEYIDLLVFKESTLKGGYLIRTVTSTAGSLPQIITYLTI